VNRTARALGIVRLFGSEVLQAPSIAPDIRERMALNGTTGRQMDTARAELVSRAADDIALRDAPSLSPLPMVVLASGENMRASADWRKNQASEARLSSNSRFEIVQDSGHYIQWKRPDRVLNAIREVVTKVRAGS
jgi:pimeloyl-ACP methyl ester carboxylesterase